jgi:probable F420-dependent oxidoreductase
MMKLGVSVPNNWGIEDASALIDFAVLAEELDFASVWASEHLVNNAYVRRRIGDRPYYHPLAVLSAIAGRTSRISLATSVIVLPFHHPFDIAKYVATLDQISKGRVILGVGVGNVQEEFEALALPWNKRGATTDESIDVLRKLWAPGPADHAGKQWNFSDVHTSPKPYRGRNIPIWVGGMSDAAYKRVGRVGDGWHPTAITAEQFAEEAEKVRGFAREYGRDPDGIDMCMRFNIALDDEEVTEVELRSTVERGDTKRMLDVCKSFEAAGATHFIYALNSHEWPVLEDTLRELAAEVLPHLS